MECPHCGVENDGLVAQCRACGRNMLEAPDADPDDATESQQSEREPEPAPSVEETDSYSDAEILAAADPLSEPPLGERPSVGGDELPPHVAAPVPSPQPRAPVSGDSTTWAMFTHLAAFSWFVGVPFGSILGPLVMWLIKKDQDPFVDAHGKAALNFHISMTIYAIGLALGGLILLVIGIGLLLWLLLIPLGIMAIALTIVAAVRASRGEYYTFPLSMQLIR